MNLSDVRLPGAGSDLELEPLLVLVLYWWLPAVAHLVVPLLVELGLVGSLVAGVRVLFIRPLLGVGVDCRFALRRRSSHERGDDARLLEDEPEVSGPQDQIDETKRLQRNTAGYRRLLGGTTERCSALIGRLQWPDQGSPPFIGLDYITNTA